MIHVSNRRCIRRLGFRTMKASRSRNIMAVLAIALTTVLFTSLFTIAASVNHSFQQENFRRMGGDSHGSIKDISLEQLEAFRHDSLLVDSWSRLFVGMAEQPPLNKVHVEVSYIEPKGAPHYFCRPVAGALPREGSDEVAMDAHILSLLGVEPVVGARVTLPITIDPSTGNALVVEHTFTLSGWWEYDSAAVASHVLLPRSAAEELVALSSVPDSITGKWNLDVMFKNAMNITKNLDTVLANQGYQNTEPGKDNYLKIGVSWAHTSARFSSSLDLETGVTIGALLLLIIFTGYLIIYNVFQVSVAGDIRLYGFLKTIGATGRQLKRIIRQQALLLSLVGIPLGLIPGYAIGNVLTPAIMSQLSYKRAFVSFNPWIFIGATAFSLATVYVSCARPGRMVARVSPVEAIRYTEGGQAPAERKAAGKRAVNGASLFKMAWANLGRNRSKTAVTVISLTLAVVLLNLTYTFASGFDMEKYLSGSVVSDFIVGHADQFVSGRSGFHSEDQTLPASMISDIEAQGGITAAGRIYAQGWNVQQFVSPDQLRQSYIRLGDDYADQAVARAEQLPDGRVVADALLYGMEDFPLGKLTLIEGELAPLQDPGQSAIAAEVLVDDYGNPIPGSAWARVGDTVTLRYVTAWGYYDIETGAELSDDELDVRWAREEYDSFLIRSKAYTEKDYTVCALVTVPNAISFRSIVVGATDYILGAAQFRQDVENPLTMLYSYDTTDEANDAMEAFLDDYTQRIQPLYSYESKQSQVDDFEGFRRMFLSVGGALSFIIGLVGVLNFINAVLTGILTRKREFAVLQSVGMTGRQLKTTLVYEGLFYTLLALALALALDLLLGLLAGQVLGELFWFFTYRPTVLPLLLVLPVFLLLGVLAPLAVYRAVARFTIVERLREAET